MAKRQKSMYKTNTLLKSAAILAQKMALNRRKYSMAHINKSGLKQLVILNPRLINRKKSKATD